jgi:hypothetical protein
MAACPSLSNQTGSTHESFQLREDFNFSDPEDYLSNDGLSKQGEWSAPQQAHSLTSIEPTAGSTASTRPPTPSLVDSLPMSSSSCVVAHDIIYFFECGDKKIKEAKTKYKYCKYITVFQQSYSQLMWNSISRKKPSGFRTSKGEFVPSTSNSVL